MIVGIQLISIALVSYVLVKQVIKHAGKLHLLDIPNERSHHCDIIPSGAGIGFIMAFFIGIFAFEFQLKFSNIHFNLTTPSTATGAAATARARF